MRRHLHFAVILLAAFATVAIAGPALANHMKKQPGEHLKSHLLFDFPLPGQTADILHSDMAFWGDKAYVGNYGGFRIFDISGTRPRLIADVRCFGPQNDVSVWDRDGDGEADLLFLSIDRTLKSAAGRPNEDAGCKASAVEALQIGVNPDGTPKLIAHDDPTGWEGIRVFDITDPRNPKLIASVYQDCGSHTHTLYPDRDPDRARNRLLILNSSYPLRPGPTCGKVNGERVGRSPVHGVIGVIEVPLNNPAAARELTELPINYPGDPDNEFVWGEHGLSGAGLEVAARACHDIAVFMPTGDASGGGLVAGACVEQAQLWRINPATGLPNTANPVWVFDDPVDMNGKTGDPADSEVAVDFWHSATFSWDGKIVNFIDESFGIGCPPVTAIGVGATEPNSDTGRMFFLDADTGNLRSVFMIPRRESSIIEVEGELVETAYCSAHLGNTVPTRGRYLLVNAWYMGGADVIDFTDPDNPKEIAFFDLAPTDPKNVGSPSGGDNWSAYWYERGRAPQGSSLTIYGNDGVHNPPTARAFEVFKVFVGPTKRVGVDHLNPQTQEFMVP